MEYKIHPSEIWMGNVLWLLLPREGWTSLRKADLVTLTVCKGTESSCKVEVWGESLQSKKEFVNYQKKVVGFVVGNFNRLNMIHVI